MLFFLTINIREKGAYLFPKRKRENFLFFFIERKRKKEIRIIKKVFLVIVYIRKVRSNLSTHTPVIQEPKKRQENRGLELFMVTMASVISVLQEVIIDSLPLKLYF